MDQNPHMLVLTNSYKSILMVDVNYDIMVDVNYDIFLISIFCFCIFLMYFSFFFLLFILLVGSFGVNLFAFLMYSNIN